MVNTKIKKFLQNNKRLWHSMKRIQSKNHKIGAYKINKTSLSYCDDKICIKYIS